MAMVSRVARQDAEARRARTDAEALRLLVSIDSRLARLTGENGVGPKPSSPAGPRKRARRTAPDPGSLLGSRLPSYRSRIHCDDGNHLPQNPRASRTARGEANIPAMR